MTVDQAVQADGGYTTIFHVERFANNQSAAQKIAVLAGSQALSIDAQRQRGSISQAIAATILTRVRLGNGGMQSMLTL